MSTWDPEPTVPADAYWDVCDERDAALAKVERGQAVTEKWLRYLAKSPGDWRNSIEEVRAALSGSIEADA